MKGKEEKREDKIAALTFISIVSPEVERETRRGKHLITWLREFLRNII